MKRLILCILLFCLIAIACERGRTTVIIGSKNFTESIILAELLAQQIEATCNCVVTRKFNLGGTFICHQALIAGQIDLYPEYTGTALTAILKLPPSSNPQSVYQTVKQEYEGQGLTLTEP